MTNHHETMTEKHHEPSREPWRTMTTHHEPWRNITNHDEPPRNITNHHETSRTMTNHHETSRTTTKHHKPWQTTTKHHKLWWNTMWAIMNHHKIFTPYSYPSLVVCKYWWKQVEGFRGGCLCLGHGERGSGMGVWECLDPWVKGLRGWVCVSIVGHGWNGLGWVSVWAMGEGVWRWVSVSAWCQGWKNLGDRCLWVLLGHG